MTRSTVYYNNGGKGKEVKSNWWDDKAITSEDRHFHIWAVVRNILEKQSYLRLNNLKYARAYQNQNIRGLDAGQYCRVNNQNDTKNTGVSLNVIKSCIDTATSKIGKSKPRPFFLTEDGNWQLQRKAQRLTQYCDGLFDSTKTYVKGREAFRDAGILGTGCIKIFREGDQVQTEKVLIDEVFVDEVEGMYGCPRQLHQRKVVFREALLAQKAYSSDENKRVKILAAPSTLAGDAAGNSVADMIDWLESWHLPSYPGAEDGRHVISINGCTLLDEPYKKDYFPFVFYRWTTPILGFYGLGMAEELIGIQLEINKLLRNIHLGHHLMAVPQAWLEIQSKIPASRMTNQLGQVNYYQGNPPVFFTPTAFNAETYQYLENLYRKAYEIVGISAMSARAEKPSGVTAAVALEALSDMESERFAIATQAYEEFYLDIARIAIDITSDIYRGDENNVAVKDLSISVEDNNFMRSIAWKDVHINENKYVMRIFPTGFLPSQPAMKFQRLEEMVERGWLSREEALMHLDYPDLKATVSRITAPQQNIARVLERIVDKQEFISPEPHWDLDSAKRLAQLEYNNAQLGNAPASVLELLDEFMNACDDLLEEVALAAQEEAMAAQAMAQPAIPEAEPEQQALPPELAAAMADPALQGV
jgi:hypothetical protein